MIVSYLRANILSSLSIDYLLTYCHSNIYVLLTKFEEKKIITDRFYHCQQEKNLDSNPEKVLCVSERARTHELVRATYTRMRTTIARVGYVRSSVCVRVCLRARLCALLSLRLVLCLCCHKSSTTRLLLARYFGNCSRTG